MPGHDIIVVGFSAAGAEALARLPNIPRRWGEFPAFHQVPKQPPAAAELT